MFELKEIFVRKNAGMRVRKFDVKRCGKLRTIFGTSKTENLTSLKISGQWEVCKDVQNNERVFFNMFNLLNWNF